MRSNLALIGPEAALLGRGPRPSGAGPEGLQGLEWWGLGARANGSMGAAARPPTPAPVGLPGPAPLSGLRFTVMDPGYRYVPVLPTRYTHPAYPPWYRTQPSRTVAASCTTLSGHPRTCTYDRFWTPEGEPRGVRTQPVLGSQAGSNLYIRFTRPFDWVLLRNRPCFTEFY